MKPIYSLKVKDDTADLFIYGDIASDNYKWSESDVSSNDIIKQLKELPAKSINVHINSYGGECAEGMAIYNALKDSSAKVTTICDGFACSAASVVFMAGDVRRMHNVSLLMIHNAWTCAQGNASQFDKEAEDLRTLDKQMKRAYLDNVNISETELDKLLAAETWISPENAVEMGFATEIVEDKTSSKASASAAAVIFKALIKAEETDEPAEEDNTDEVISDIISRLEKLEAEVFKTDETDDGADVETEKEKSSAENGYMDKLLNIFKK